MHTVIPNASPLMIVAPKPVVLALAAALYEAAAELEAMAGPDIGPDIEGRILDLHWGIAREGSP